MRQQARAALRHQVGIVLEMPGVDEAPQTLSQAL